jgi:hypothetical protein
MAEDGENVIIHSPLYRLEGVQRGMSPFKLLADVFRSVAYSRLFEQTGLSILWSNLSTSNTSLSRETGGNRVVGRSD